jgi:hypothetical protein
MSFISQTFDRRFASLKRENVNRPTDPIDSNGRKDKNDTRDDLFFGAIHSTRRCCGAAILTAVLAEAQSVAPSRWMEQEMKMR